MPDGRHARRRPSVAGVLWSAASRAAVPVLCGLVGVALGVLLSVLVHP
ncbi:hypothetical protein [Streptomyces sp. RFCAC02]|nr:hypothetical protein [Streptomyces sp. RFCAC02]